MNPLPKVRVSVRPKWRTVAIWALTTLVVIASAAGFAWLGIERSMQAPGPHTSAVRLHVVPGQGIRRVLADLAAKGVIVDGRRTEFWLRLKGSGLRIKAGNYEIPAGASPLAILEQLRAGRVILEAVTVVEGATFAELRRALETHPRIRSTQRGRTAAEVMTALGRVGEHPEGRFFPDTYRFADGTTDLEILDLAYRQMSVELVEAWQERASDLPLSTTAQALTLASIVEKETARADERPQIAGVYVTRLRRGMRLQSDPTVIYGLGDGYSGDIRKRDLERDTPYNTYTRSGLPPTPIALPGRAALRAATRPQETGAIFFVATGEPDGSHFFSKSYEEHRQGIARMLARQRQRGQLTHEGTP